MAMQETELIFLGTSVCIPETGDDTASFLVGGELLIDVGWHVTDRLRLGGYAPAGIDTLCFTHMHHDHMMALPAFLYERYARGTAGALNVYGPYPMKRAIEDAKRFLQLDVYWPDAMQPNVHVLRSGDSFQTEHLSVQTMASDHAVPGLCYRVEDRRSGVVLGFGGDGAYQDELAGFFQGCDVLIHEFSFGLQKPADNQQRHSDICDAARVARDAGARMLCPVHGPARMREACEAKARRIYDGRLLWPAPGERLLICKGSGRLI